MIAKSSTGDESPARASRSEAHGSDDVWCTSGGGVPSGCSVLATGRPVIPARSSRNFASPPVITPRCCSPAAMARQRSLSSDNCSTPRSERMLRADEQPSASAISLPGLRYSHMPCGTEIDSICASSVSDPASAAARRTARTMSRQGSAHSVGSSDVSRSKPIPTITGVFGAISFTGLPLLASVDRLALLREGAHAFARVPRAEDRTADLELPRERLGLGAALVDLAQHLHQSADRERTVLA